MVLRGTRSTLWFDLVSGVYVGRYGTKFTLTHDTRAGVFNLAAPKGEITVFDDSHRFDVHGGRPNRDAHAYGDLART